MKNYQDSDYAANKYASGIVYRFANQTVEVTLEDYLRENPNNTEADFAELKAMSDNDYFECDRKYYRQTWKNIPLHSLDESEAFVIPSPEDELIEKSEQAKKKKRRRELVNQSLYILSDVQRRRLLLHRVYGLTMREIAEKEGVSHSKIQNSITAAEMKINGIFGRLLGNRGYKTPDFSRYVRGLETSWDEPTNE